MIANVSMSHRFHSQITDEEVSAGQIGTSSVAVLVQVVSPLVFHHWWHGHHSFSLEVEGLVVVIPSRRHF